MTPLPKRIPHLALYRETKTACRGRIAVIDRVIFRPVPASSR
jgi:hypothetical protein